MFRGDLSEVQAGIEVIDVNMPADVFAYKNDCLKIDIQDNACNIGYSCPTDFFRGLALAKNSITNGETEYHSIQKRRFDTCGIMLDCSRNAVPTVSTVKNIISYMAKMGLNMLMLYTEDTFKIDDLPYFGYMRGAYRENEIQEIDIYAKKFGIEVIPCIQTLGHLGRALQWDYTKDISDTGGILLADEEKTYEFIEKMIAACRKCYTSGRIHIGMDEAYSLGRGAYLDKHGYEDRFDIFYKHVNRVLEILKKYDFKPMMWGDMLLDPHTPNDLANYIATDAVEMVAFDYSSLTEENYDKFIQLYKSKGYETAFAGGVKIWNSLSPNYNGTFAATYPALRSCLKNQTKTVYATIWADDGGECSVFTSLLGMQIYAEFNYHGDCTEKNLSEGFMASTGADARAFYKLGLDDFGEDICPTHESGAAKQIFYQDILLGLLDKNLEMYDFKTYYKEILTTLESIALPVQFETLLNNTKLLAQILYEKCDIGIRLYKAYHEHDRGNLEMIRDELCHLQRMVESWHEGIASQWYNDNKPFGFEVLDARIGGVTARINRAYKRVSKYLNGEINAIQELEEERLLYGGIQSPLPRGKRGWWYANVFTAAFLVGA